MPKSKPLYPKGYVTKVINSIPESRRIVMKACVRAGCGVDYLIERFNLSDTHARIVYLHYKPDDITPLAQIGTKDVPYYEEEFPVVPTYTLKDLSEDEKKIAEKDTSTKLWTWEE
jgi:hypothetical protein